MAECDKCRDTIESIAAYPVTRSDREQRRLTVYIGDEDNRRKIVAYIKLRDSRVYTDTDGTTHKTVWIKEAGEHSAKYLKACTINVISS